MSFNTVRFRACVGAALCLGSTWQIAAADTLEAHELLDAMKEAVHGLEYSGTLSYFNGVGVSSYFHKHLVVDGVEHESIVHLNGPYREIVRIGTIVRVFQKEDGQLMEIENAETEPIAVKLGANIQVADDVYSIAISGNDRIADRNAQIIEISPKTEDRNLVRYFVDERTKLLLRMDVRNQEGQYLEVLQFATIEIAVEDCPTADCAVSYKKVIPAIPAKKITPGGVRIWWHARYMPHGFTLTGRDSDSLTVNKMFFSDGLVEFSIFVEKKSPEVSPIQVQRGATVVVSEETQDLDGNPHVITVVGEVPLQTARRIAKAVEHRQ